MSETQYNPLINNRGRMRGNELTDPLPVGRGQHSFYAALRAVEKSRGDLFSGSVKGRNLSIKEGYSFSGGEGKVLVDRVAYKGNDTNPSGFVNIYQNSAAMSGGGGDDDDGGNDDGGGNDGTTGPVDPIGPVTGGDGGSGGGGSSGPSLQDLIDTIANMSAPTINIPPPPVYEPPPSFAAVGYASSANPGVRIRRSRSRAQGTNTLGTNFFNRGTRNTLRISGLNV